MLDRVEIPRLRVIAEYIAKRIASFLKTTTLPKTVVDVKEGDIVREFDVQAEKLAIKLISDLIPKSIVVGEEVGEVRLHSNPDYIVVVDPVDGSNNFVVGIPWVAVNVAIARIDTPSLNNVLASATVSIYTNEVYSFSISEGVLLNGEPLKELEPFPMVVVYADDISRLAPLYELRKEMNFKIRSLGCISLDLALLLKGSVLSVLDLRYKLRNVDIAAMVPMLIYMKRPIYTDPIDLEKIQLDKLVGGITMITSINEGVHKKILNCYGISG